MPLINTYKREAQARIIKNLEEHCTRMSNIVIEREKKIKRRCRSKRQEKHPSSSSKIPR